MRVLLATRRLPKINGIKQGFEEAMRHFLIPTESLKFEARETESGVTATPQSIEELMAGAATRARSIYESTKPEIPEDERIVAAGAEGGVWRNSSAAFLQSWVCIFDGSEMHFGSSGAVEIPASFIKEIFEKGNELGVVIDRFADEHDVRSRQGTWGVLTKDLVTREDSFAEATRNALMPILHSILYEKDVA
jgi:non-canonical (house-cleaning) NTP pyrophosphatase